MMLWPRFVYPGMLVLLILVPWSIWMGMRIHSLAPARKWFVIAMRTLTLFALIGALAGMELVKKNDKLAVFFLMDQSDSIPASLRQVATETIKQISSTFMTHKDESGLIAFGKDASIELTMGPNLSFETIQSYVGGDQTDIASAIRLAMAAFPQGAMRRLVIFSDGNETRGSAIEEAKLAQAAGVEVDVVPLTTEEGQEVRVREVSSPSRVNANEPFQVRVVVSADQDCTGTLRLFQREREGKRAVPPGQVTLHKGDNVFLLPQTLENSGFYEYEAAIESEADTVLANNRGRSFTIIHGEPTVLYVEADPSHSPFLSPALRAEGLKVTEATLGGVPASLAQFQNFDVVILSNVSSTDLSSEQLTAAEAMVRDLGIGLVMIGGPNAFGAGGFHGTPVEKALPVNMDLKQRKILPRGALVLVLHTCEIQDGNAWAREIGLASLNVLSSQDLMGAIAYLGTGEDWIFKLQPVGDKSLMRSALIQAQPGDMPSLATCVQGGYDALAAADAAVKRMVIITDGDPAPPGKALIDQIIAAGISVSTVCIAPHSQNDQSTMETLAQVTGGQYYFVTNPNNLPQIFTKEAAVVKRGVLVEEEFTPVAKDDSELLRGLTKEGFPLLRGYVATTPKENATIPLVTHQDDPLLAHWRYGLGKSVAFTSDVTNRWAADWVTWKGFNQFWAQTVRWAMREVTRSSFRVETNARDGKGHIRIDAVDDKGAFVNFLRPEGNVTGPGPAFARTPVTLMQTGPGIYEGTFPVADAGVYMINLTYQMPDGSTGMIPAGLSLNYSREYEYVGANLPYLERIAAAGGGKVYTPPMDPYEHNLVASASVTPVWQYLAGFAACLLPVEIFVRRVMVNLWGGVLWLLGLLRKIPGVRRFMPAPAPRRVRVTGAYGAMPARQFVYTASGEGGILLDANGQRVPIQNLEGAISDTVPQEHEAVPDERPGSSEYTRQLLAAKERAQLSPRRRHDANTTNKEDS